MSSDKFLFSKIRHHGSRTRRRGKTQWQVSCAEYRVKTPNGSACTTTIGDDLKSGRRSSVWLEPAAGDAACATAIFVERCGDVAGVLVEMSQMVAERKLC